jgi:hypothetical protein
VLVDVEMRLINDQGVFHISQLVYVILNVEPLGETKNETIKHDTPDSTIQGARRN